MADEQANVGGGGSAQATKVAVQFKKLRDTNDKYKDVLKLAKERIQDQEDEIRRLKEEYKRKSESDERDSNSMYGMDDADAVGDAAEHSCTIVRVCQRICVELLPHEVNPKGERNEYWALVEFEVYNPDQPEHVAPKRLKKWKRFDVESDLQDFVRRDTGEPIVLPPPSLTPQQSAQIQEDAEKKVSEITEEFRRFRVKAEMGRKQADQHIRELQNSKVETTKRQIEANNSHNNSHNNSSSSSNIGGISSSNGQGGKKIGGNRSNQNNTELEELKLAMANQEAQWKRAYDMLLDQNEMLQSTGSEALLASQWRNRYEAMLREKEIVENKLRAQKSGNGDEGKFEEKYRDLKESFRLYRKKAKEIFEAQQKGETGLITLSDPTGNGAEGKLDYLRNLMVNYLISDWETREKMENAIGTVLQFTPNDIAKIDKKKKDDEYWNLFA